MQNTVVAETLSKIFRGSGNNESDSKENAEVRYSTWKLEQKRAGREINELKINYTYKQINDVHCRCEIEVVYLIQAS